MNSRLWQKSKIIFATFHIIPEISDNKRLMIYVEFFVLLRSRKFSLIWTRCINNQSILLFTDNKYINENYGL
jgi:hypothetical protein